MSAGFLVGGRAQNEQREIAAWCRGSCEYDYAHFECLALASNAGSALGSHHETNPKLLLRHPGNI